MKKSDKMRKMMAGMSQEEIKKIETNSKVEFEADKSKSEEEIIEEIKEAIEEEKKEEKKEEKVIKKKKKKEY